MDNKKLNKDLRDKAKSLGLCALWTKNWRRDKSVDDLIEMYIKGYDFCIEHDYPSVDFIKGNFDRDILHKHGVWVDEEVIKTKDMMIINGNCYGKLVFDNFDVATVFIRHESKITIVCNKYSRISIRAYEKANVNVINKGFNKQYVYAFGDNVVVTSVGDVTVHRETD